MIMFELTFPCRGSWNGKWSGEKDRHCVFMRENRVPRNFVGQTYLYDFGDGWTAKIEVTKIDYGSYRKMKKVPTGFCGYNWMVKSIVSKGKIEKMS